MKILVCTDGSGHSQRAVEETVKIAVNLKNVEVSVIYVCETVESSVFDYDKALMRAEEMKKIKRSNRILNDAYKAFEANNLKPDIILKRGNPGREIIKEASDGEYFLVILGTRKIGGFKKLFLGSVCNTVVQGVRTNVMIVTY